VGGGKRSGWLPSSIPRSRSGCQSGPHFVGCCHIKPGDIGTRVYLVYPSLLLCARTAGSQEWGETGSPT